MEEELRRPRPVPPAPPATASPHASELLLSVSEEQLRLDGTVGAEGFSGAGPSPQGPEVSDLFSGIPLIHEGLDTPTLMDDPGIGEF